MFSPEVNFALRLVKDIRQAVLPVYGLKEQDVPFDQISRDYNYAVDQVGEAVIPGLFEKMWDSKRKYGYATENSGLVLPPDGNPTTYYLIDPADGSRPIQAGAEMAGISITGAQGGDQPVLRNIRFGVAHAIKENLTYVCERGRGIFVIKGRNVQPVQKRENIPASLKDSSAVCETYTMSNMYAGVVLDPLVREIHFKMDYPSGLYAGLTLVRGQNELQVDIRRRILLEYPGYRESILLKASPKFVAPMDFGPCYLMIKELGGISTDGSGNSLEDFPLWMFNEDGSWSENYQTSLLASISPQLHEQALAKIEEGFDDLDRLLKLTA